MVLSDTAPLEHHDPGAQQGGDGSQSGQTVEGCSDGEQPAGSRSEVPGK